MYLQSKAASEWLLASTGIRIIRPGVVLLFSSAIFNEENPQQSVKCLQSSARLLSRSLLFGVERLIDDVCTLGGFAPDVTLYSTRTTGLFYH